MASFTQVTPRRGRTLPESSIFYRTVRDLAPMADSEARKAWIAENWATTDIRCAPFGQAEYNRLAADPANPGYRQPSWYLDAPQYPVPGFRECSTTVQKHFSPFAYKPNFFFPNQTADMRLTEVSRWRAEAGMPGNNFRPNYQDCHYSTYWPSLRVTQEAILFDAIFDNRAESFTERGFDSNAFQNMTDSSEPAGSTAGRVPVVSLMLTCDEVKRGWVGHMLCLVVEQYRGPGNHLWPARGADGLYTDPLAPKGGTCFRLRADFDDSAFHPQMKPVVQALKDHGCIIMDRFGSTGAQLITANDPGWADFVSFPANAITVSDFDLIDLTQVAVSPTTSWQCTPPGA